MNFNKIFNYSFLKTIALFLIGIFACLGRWDGEFFPKSIMAAGVAIPLIISFILFLKEKKINCLNFLGWYGIFYLFLLFSWTYTANTIDPEIIVRRCFFVLLIGLTITQLINNRNDFIILMKGIIIGALLTAIVVFIVESHLIGSDRIGSIVCGAQTSFASIILIGFWCSLFLLLFLKAKKYIVLICFFEIAIVLTGSRMPLLISIASITVAYFLWSSNNFQKIKRAFFIFVFFVIVFYLLLNVPLLYDVIGNRIETMFTALVNPNNLSVDSSINGRTMMKKEALKLWKASPIYGHGVNSFWVLSPITNLRANSHCGFTEILCSFGLIGFMLFYWPWFWIILKNLWRSIKIKAKNKELTLFTVLIIMLFVMEWQTTSFESATTVSFLAVIFKILKYPKQYNL